MTEQEADYANEAKNAEMFRQNFQEQERLQPPKEDPTTTSQPKTFCLFVPFNCPMGFVVMPCRVLE